MMLSFDNVEFHYKNQPVFTNLNMELDYGEFVFVIGKSGIGKSTLMQLIYMNQFPLTGTCSDCGVSIRRQLNHLRYLCSEEKLV